MTKFILASKSPRRKEILEGLGLKFEIITAYTDESCDKKDPRKYASELALRKAVTVFEKIKNDISDDTIIIASDTVVAAGGEILGKPKDKNDAKRMIALLSGKRHSVISGIALVSKNIQISDSEATGVIFDKVTESDLDLYVSTNEPYDKAGAYAIQGFASMWITGIEGDYFNVVGLPVKKLRDMLLKYFGINLATLIDPNA